MRAVVGLGSNLGDRLEHLRAAASRIPGVVARSRIYESAPVGGPPQGAFLNAAVLVECTDLRELLAALQAIETDLGRVREERWGPRTIDLDILWADGVALEDPDLAVPHPRLHERAFAILPLLDLVPNAPFLAPDADVARTELVW